MDREPIIPADWRKLKPAEHVALAAQIIGRSNIWPADAQRIIEAYVASDREADPAPLGNGVADALGTGKQPDWLLGQHKED